ncbi:hypothetical protein GF324_03705 [bacterium]|nr:hypothetical protein [bacterium]
MAVIVNWKVWSIRIIIFLVLFLTIYISLMTPDQREEFFSKTDLTQKLYDYYDYKRYQEDLEDIQYYGTIEVSMYGDTTEVDFNDSYLTWFTRERYGEYFGKVPYFDIGQIYAAESTAEIDSMYRLSDDEIGYIWLNVTMRDIPLFSKRMLLTVELVGGTEADQTVYRDTMTQLASKQYLEQDIEKYTAFLMKMLAKRFFKVKGDEEQLKILYRSIYRT